jgi:hypothetical protein
MQGKERKLEIELESNRFEPSTDHAKARPKKKEKIIPNAGRCNIEQKQVYSTVFRTQAKKVKLGPSMSRNALVSMPCCALAQAK